MRERFYDGAYQSLFEKYSDEFCALTKLDDAIHALWWFQAHRNSNTYDSGNEIGEYGGKLPFSKQVFSNIMRLRTELEEYSHKLESSIKDQLAEKNVVKVHVPVEDAKDLLIQKLKADCALLDERVKEYKKYIEAKK